MSTFNLLPTPLVDLILKRGHLRNLEKLLERDYPKIRNQLLRRYPSIPEAVFLEMGGELGSCITCGGRTRFVNYKKGYASHCGNACRACSPSVIAKRKTTCLRKFGATSPMGSKVVRRAFKTTMLKRYGVEWAMQSKEIQLKSIETCLDKFGVEYNVQRPEFKEHITAIKDQIQKARERTFRKRLGVRSPLQDPRIFEQQQKTAVTVRSESIGGKEFEFRGYEGYVIRYLVEKRRVPPSRIVNRAKEGLPTFWYADTEGTRRRYYPDLYVKGTDVIVEVKSTRTLGIHDPSMFKRNVSKFKAVTDAGYELWLAVSNQRGDNIAWIKNPRSLSKVRSRLKNLGFF